MVRHQQQEALLGLMELQLVLRLCGQEEVERKVDLEALVQLLAEVLVVVTAEMVDLCHQHIQQAAAVLVDTQVMEEMAVVIYCQVCRQMERVAVVVVELGQQVQQLAVAVSGCLALVGMGLQLL